MNYPGCRVLGALFSPSPHRTAHVTLCVTCSVFIVSRHTPHTHIWLMGCGCDLGEHFALQIPLGLSTLNDRLPESDRLSTSMTKTPPGDSHTITYLVGVLALFGFM